MYAIRSYYDIKKQIIRVKRETWEDYSIFVSINPNKELKYIAGSILSHSENTTYMHIDVKDITFSRREIDSVLIPTL